MFTPPNLPLLLAAVLSGGIALAGVALAARYGQAVQDKSVLLAGFAAGVLITAAMLHLIPEALEMAPDGAPLMLAGFLVMVMANGLAHVCFGESHHDHSAAHDHADRAPIHRDRSSALIVVSGIGFHSLVDGLIYAVTFSVSPFLGAISTMGLILHEAPEGIISYGILRRGGFTNRQAFRGAVIAAAATTPLAALIAYPFVASLTEPVIGRLLALSAGALLYVGASHLLPEAQHDRRVSTSLAIALGVALSVVTSLLAH